MEEQPQHEGDSVEIVNVHGLTAMVTSLPSPESTEKQCSPPPLSFWAVTFAYLTPLKIINTILICLYISAMADSC